MDTKARRQVTHLAGHITEPGDNIFLEAGFPEAEARLLHELAQAEADQTLTIKHQLMKQITIWMQANKYTHTKAAEILMITRPRMTDLVNGKTAKFTIDMLMSLAARAGFKVIVEIAPRQPA